MRPLRHAVILVMLPLLVSAATLPPTFIGSWSGTGRESDGSIWTIWVQFRPDGTYLERYPSLACRARLELLEATDTHIVLREHMLPGSVRCTDKGVLTLELESSNTLRLKWRSADETKSGVGQLTRTRQQLI